MILNAIRGVSRKNKFKFLTKIYGNFKRTSDRETKNEIIRFKNKQNFKNKFKFKKNA